MSHNVAACRVILQLLAPGSRGRSTCPFPNGLVTPGYISFPPLDDFCGIQFSASCVWPNWTHSELERSRDNFLHAKMDERRQRPASDLISIPATENCFTRRGCQGLSSPPLFSAAHFPGHCSGQFLRPAASRFLLSRFLLNDTGPSHKAPARLGSSGLSLLGAPGKWGKKKEKNSCLTYMLSGIASG
jgi:hypothetical protein